MPLTGTDFRREWLDYELARCRTPLEQRRRCWSELNRLGQWTDWITLREKLKRMARERGQGC